MSPPFPIPVGFFSSTGGGGGGGGIVTGNLELHLDAADAASYGGSGTTWSDLTSNNYDFTLTGSPTYTASPGYFNFPSSGVRATNSDTISITTGTAEFWIRVNNDGLTGGRIFMGCDLPGAGQGHWFGTGHFAASPTDESIEFNHNSGPTMDYRNGHADFADGVWRHAVSVVDGVDNKLYIDGAAVTTYFRIGNSTSTSGKLWNTSVTYPALIGGYTNTSYTFIGDVAVVRFYSVGLSASEVLQNYNNDKTRFGH